MRRRTEMKCVVCGGFSSARTCWNCTHKPVHYFCDNTNCRNHKPVQKGMLFMQVLNQPVSPFCFDDRTTATEKMMVSKRTITRRNFTDGVRDWWFCSDCIEKGKQMSESPMRINSGDAPYEFGFMINNRSPWVDILTSSTTTTSTAGATVRVVNSRWREIDKPVEPPVDSEELMYPI